MIIIKEEEVKQIRALGSPISCSNDFCLAIKKNTLSGWGWHSKLGHPNPTCPATHNIQNIGLFKLPNTQSYDPLSVSAGLSHAVVIGIRK